MNSPTQSSQMLRLIDCYCTTSQRLLLGLKNALGTGRPILAEIRGEARRPSAATIGGFSYQVHGGGIRISDGLDALDIELGDNDFACAFDAWRISAFARTKPDFSAFSEPDVAEESLLQLADQGLISSYQQLGSQFYCRVPLRSDHRS